MDKTYTAVTMGTKMFGDNRVDTGSKEYDAGFTASRNGRCTPAAMVAAGLERPFTREMIAAFLCGETDAYVRFGR